MEAFHSGVPQLEGEENLIAAARQIVKALGSQKNLTDDARKVLADLGTQLSNITIISEDKDNDDDAEDEEEEEEHISELEAQLNTVQEKVSIWEADQSMIWDLGPEEAADFLNTTFDAQKLCERLVDLCNGGGDDNGGGRDLLRRAYDVLQMAMARLEQEFNHLLVQNQLPFDRELVSFRSSEDDGIDFSSVVSTGDDSGFDDPIARVSVSKTWEENNIMDLVHPDAIPDLRDIANLMFDAGYGHECSQAYITVRRDALDECLFNLDMERLSIEDVLRLEWGSLNSKIKKWVRALKVFVRVYLASERFLSEQVFGQLETTTDSDCFIEASKASMLQLLNFGEAISIGPHKPEKLFPILDMYEVLVDVLPDLDALYTSEVGSCVRTDCHELQRRLGDSVRAAFLEFENAIATSISTNPFAGGGIHHLTRYVMNYLNTLIDHQDSLNTLLKDQDRVHHPIVMSPDVSPSREEDDNNNAASLEAPTQDYSAMALHFRTVTSILECNLDDKARLYRDSSLQQVFLMNNIHYMAQKVKNSALRHIFGDEWIRKRNWKFQQHAMSYERATWSSILSLLKEEGNSSHSSSGSRSQLRDMIKNFYIAFEDAYRTQTSWLIPDGQLREDLRISTSLKVIQAYRNFIGRHTNSIGDRHIKYSADDLQNYLLDLFEGSQKSLQNSHRR